MPSPSPSPSPVRVVSRRTVKPAPRARHLIPLTTWDMTFLSADYIQKGLLYARPPFPTVPRLLDHLQASLQRALDAYYPVAGRFATEQHRDADGDVSGCSVFIDCDGQGVDIIHAVADGVAISDVIPPDADVPLHLVQSLFPLDGAINHDGHHLPLFAVQVTDLVDGVFLGFAYSHALTDGTAFWDFLNAWADIARRSGDDGKAPTATLPPVLERWSPDGRPGPVVLPYPDLTGLVERLSPPPLRERMLHFSADSLEALKARAREELLAAGDAEGAAALTKFQALSSLVWRCVTRARRPPPGQLTACRAAISNRARLRPQLPREYFGNSVYAISAEPARADDLLERGHGWAAAAVGRAVAAHTDADIRARVAAWTAKPVLYNLRFFDPNAVMMGSSPRFDMYGCDFGWGAPLAARSGRANKSDGKASLYPGRDGGGSIDVELVLTPENMARLEQDHEFWAAVSPDNKRPPYRTGADADATRIELN